MFIKSLHMVIVCLLLITTSEQTIAQYAEVKKVSAETASGIKFDVWVESTSVLLGENITVHVIATNHSSKPIYIVKKMEPESRVITSEYLIQISPPFPFPLNHGGFDYTFMKVESGKSHHYTFTLPKTLISEDGIWQI